MDVKGRISMDKYLYYICILVIMVLLVHLAHEYVFPSNVCSSMKFGLYRVLKEILVDKEIQVFQEEKVNLIFI